MGKRGPKAGSGGRPRAAVHAGNARDGYKRVTIGPKSKGDQVYEHRAKAGVAKAGPNTTVDHKDSNTSNNKAANLQVVSRSKNVALENKRRAKKS